jgi:hydroxymethylpyrimidine pyrophosphatase-like HAD family hydrolase
MSQSYQRISTLLASQLKLIMTDVDGTITTGGDSISSAVSQSIRHLEEQGIIVGLVSGRTLARLESLAHTLDISGPIIAENGGVAKLKADTSPIDLGYSRQPALEALAKLKTLYPGSIKEREDNKDRFIDVVLYSHGIEVSELRGHLGNTQLLDSGYILHLMQEGISKGKTLMRLLGEVADGTLTPTNVMVFGDSVTDLSLFELFPHNVFITNPRLTPQQFQELKKIAEYVTDHNVEEGFVRVVSHIINVRARET